MIFFFYFARFMEIRGLFEILTMFICLCCYRFRLVNVIVTFSRAIKVRKFVFNKILLSLTQRMSKLFQFISLQNSSCFASSGRKFKPGNQEKISHFRSKFRRIRRIVFAACLGDDEQSFGDLTASERKMCSTKDALKKLRHNSV